MPPQVEEINPTERYTGLADAYSLSRPEYPASAIDFILRQCHLPPGSTVADIGSGTGISSRALANRGLRVFGIEPNADMRDQAQTLLSSPGSISITYLDGRGEDTGLAEAGLDAVISATAFHWFDPTLALREFHRILKPGGWAILMWNKLDETHDFTREYLRVLRQQTGRMGHALLETPLFAQTKCTSFPNEQLLDEERLVLRAKTAPGAPRDRDRLELLANDFRASFARFAVDGHVVLRYETLVYTGKRVDSHLVPINSCRRKFVALLHKCRRKMLA